MQSPSLCRTAPHCSRRSLLRFAGGSLFLSPLAAQLALAEESNPAARPKSVIMLWMEGAPSQLETFDPHPGTKIGGDAKAIATSNKDLLISDLLPQVAEQMHRAALVRSVTGKEGDHLRAVYNVKTGYRPNPSLVHPSIGSVLCHQSNVGAEIPRHISILPGGSPARGGYLGPTYDAFKVYDPNTSVPDVSRRVDVPRFNRRIEDLLEVVEGEFARGRLPDLERNRTLHATATRAALTMMDSTQLTAFDVSQESQTLVDAFGDTSFGRGCVAASRLIEVGVRCVEVTLGGWDSHVTNHTLHASACGILDPALASLLRRLADRDLLSTTLVVCAGEFGRTPNINPAEGRDHWAHGFSVLLAGGGLRSGVVHGATAAEPNSDPAKVNEHVQDPVSIADLHATIFRTLGSDPQEELITPIGRPLKRSEGRAIEVLL